MFDLDFSSTILLLFSLFAACAFEFVNGFHDTANAVATVIYTNSLRPLVAVTWSGICNFLGVLVGGIGVAMGIVNLLPVELLVGQEVGSSLAMVFALLLSAIIWNIGTWYFGLPSSSSHTLIGSILGVGLAFGLMSKTNTSVNWDEAVKIGLSLLLSPLIGFGLTVLMMAILRNTVKDPALFKEPDPKKTPPSWIRAILIATCTGVSFAHGNNDGQKGVGLIMLILIGIVPAHFAIKSSANLATVGNNIAVVQQVISKIDEKKLTESEQKTLTSVKEEITSIQPLLKKGFSTLKREEKLEIRKDILYINKNVENLAKHAEGSLSKEDKELLSKNLKATKELVEYIPEGINLGGVNISWVTILIALSLGLGTMVGWKRIVVTIGEKIGKSHLTYAQGASAEFVAASLIAFTSFVYKLPVSTTHILSSGIAGSMFANGGLGNINPKTIRNIALAWVLTLPVSIMLSMTLYWIFRHIF
jgi:PiT family inorganic phosphate transporter